MSDHEEKLTAEAKAYIDKMKASLRELGVNLANGVDIQEQARVISNRIAANEAAAQHDLDCAARERDTAQAHAKELEAKLEALKRERHNESVRSGERIQDLTRRCADLEAAINQATAQISAQSKELGRVYAERDHFGAMFAEGSPMRLEAAQRAEKADPTHSYDAEIVAARIDALKMLGVNPYNPPVCIAGAAKKRAKTLEHADKLESDVAAVWELWGCGREVKPGALHELCQEQERLNTALRMKLGAIAEMLDGAIMPKNYGRNETGGPIPLTDRVAILIASEAEEKRMVKRWREAAMNEGEEITDARCVLDELGAPAHAGEIALTIAARIRALPGLLRKD